MATDDAKRNLTCKARPQARCSSPRALEIKPDRRVACSGAQSRVADCWPGSSRGRELLVSIEAPEPPLSYHLRGESAVKRRGMLGVAGAQPGQRVSSMSAAMDCLNEKLGLKARMALWPQALFMPESCMNPLVPGGLGAPAPGREAPQARRPGPGASEPRQKLEITSTYIHVHPRTCLKLLPSLRLRCVLLLWLCFRQWQTSMPRWQSTRTLHGTRTACFLFVSRSAAKLWAALRVLLHSFAHQRTMDVTFLCYSLLLNCVRYSVAAVSNFKVRPTLA